MIEINEIKKETKNENGRIVKEQEVNLTDSVYHIGRICIAVPGGADQLGYFKEIGKQAFYRNNNLTKVTISDDVKVIGDYCFMEDFRLEEVNINEFSNLEIIVCHILCL